MEILSESKIKKFVKNQILLELNKAKKELDLSENKIKKKTNLFFSNIKDKVYETLQPIFNDCVFSQNQYEFSLTRDNIKAAFKIYFRYNNITNNKEYYFKPIYEYYFSYDQEKEIKSYILMGNLCNSILNKELDDILIFVDSEKKILEQKIIETKNKEIQIYIDLLMIYLEKIRIDEVFKEGNTFKFNWKEKVQYGRIIRESIYVDVLHIVRITPTMCIFKLKRNENDKEFFNYVKKIKKTITQADGSKVKITNNESTDLIKKNKEYVYKFVKNKKMNLIVTQSRALKLKNIFESENV